MDPMEIVDELVAEPERAPGSDAERRAAQRVRRRLRGLGREVVVEPAWVRPHWPLVHALHAALAVAAALVAVSRPIIGLVAGALVLLSSALDLLGAGHLLRRLTPERATQNLVSSPPASPAREAPPTVRLVIVAHYDAPRGGLVRRPAARRLAAGLQRAARGRLPGALGFGTVVMALLVGVAVVRVAGGQAPALDIVTLAASLWLLGLLALVVDSGLADPGPGANEPASGAAIAVALAHALHRAPPRHLAVELVLAGAGCGPALGMRAFVRARRRRYAPESTAVLHIAGCGRGRPAWWTVDGPLLSRRLHPALREHCAAVARRHPELGARPHRGHGAGAAWRARLAGWPAITVGCLDGQGLAAGLGRAGDDAASLDPGAMDGALRFCRAVVDELDAELGRRPAPAPSR